MEHKERDGERRQRQRERGRQSMRGILYEPERSVSIELLLDYTCQIGREQSETEKTKRQEER